MQVTDFLKDGRSGRGLDVLKLVTFVPDPPLAAVLMLGLGKASMYTRHKHFVEVGLISMELKGVERECSIPTLVEVV
jgi:hypothetical protein